MGYDVAFIGTGANPDEEDTDGYAMAYRHARAYARLSDCEFVACADIVPENAATFADRFDIPREHVYEDHERMLAAATPDVVSVCVPPPSHAELVIDCARSGAVRAIHCEKPMAHTWGASREMARVCDRQDVQLTINHQRRFARPFTRAKALVDEGRIGELRRIEIGGPNLYDYGTHLFDMCSYLTDHATAEWVLCALEYGEMNRQFGVHNENQAIAQWRYETGVHGVAATGDASAVPCQLRLVGERGLVEIGPEDGPPLRVRTDGAGWRTVDTDGDGVYRRNPGRLTAAAVELADRLPGVRTDAVGDSGYVDRAIEDVVGALREDRDPELAARKALDGTELVFACWESARRRGRVDLPLEIEDNPLASMVESGVLSPQGR
jgi:predicted dehydrogenase